MRCNREDNKKEKTSTPKENHWAMKYNNQKIIII